MYSAISTAKNGIIDVGCYIADIDVGMVQYILNIAFEVLIIYISFGIKNQSSNLFVAFCKKAIIFPIFLQERECVFKSQNYYLNWNRDLLLKPAPSRAEPLI